MVMGVASNTIDEDDMKSLRQRAEEYVLHFIVLGSSCTPLVARKMFSNVMISSMLRMHIDSINTDDFF